MEQVYDLKELQGYFQAWNSPKQTVAEINKVIVQLADWFIKAGDPSTEVFYLKDCMEFLINLRAAIEEVTPI